MREGVYGTDEGGQERRPKALGQPVRATALG